MAGGEQMPDISEILCGIYENRTYPVIVYNLNGTVLWQNEPAGRYFSEKLDASRHIYADILSVCADSGLIKYGNGGKFHTAEIYGVRCIITELSECSNLLDFYSEPTVIEFTRNSDELVRQAVTKISASCSFLNDIIDESEKKEAGFYLNSITSGCFRILRSVLINSLLAKAADERNCNPVLIWAEVYLKEIVQQCQRILGEDYMVS